MIGGFTYQILLTILRWVELDDQSSLACEYGEDIYQEAAAQNNGAPIAVRMEQVKQRSRNVTLADRHVAKALVDFADHSNRFPEANLSFRFSTNARPGKEKAAKFPDGATGIEAWILLANGAYVGTTRNRTIAAIQKILASYPIAWFPPTYKKRLARFKELVQDEVTLTRFVEATDFSVAGPTHAELAQTIASKLTELGYASNMLDARQILYALISELFLMLSERGVKQLTLNDLSRIASDPRSLSTDSGNIEMLLVLAKQSISGLADLKIGQNQILAGLSSIGADIESLLGLGATTISMESSSDPYPRLPTVYASRQALLQQCEEGLKSRTWVAILGETGCGKTLLASRLIDENNPRHRWISLSDQPPSEMGVHLEHQLVGWAAALFGSEFLRAFGSNQISIAQAVTLIGQALGDRGRLVVDDLPDYDPPAAVQALLSHVARTFESSDCRMVTTSHTLSTRLSANIGVSRQDVIASTLADEDIREMLTRAGAPSDFDIDRAIPIVQATTGSHPSLVAVAVAYLSNSTWPSLGTFFTGLFTDQPLERIKTEAWLSLTRLLAERERELLARLSLMTLPFDEALIDACAATTPTISLPGEIIAKLKGAFLTEVSNSRLTVTALLRGAGQKVLPLAQLPLVHRSIASAILAKGTVNVENAPEIAGHLRQAGDSNAYTVFLIQLMMAAKTPQMARGISWAAHVTDPLDQLEGDLAAALALGFAVEQYRLQTLLGETATAQLEKVQNLIGNLPLDGSSMNPSMVIFALLTTGVLLDDADPLWSLEAALKATRLVRSMPGAFPSEIGDKPFDFVILIAAFRMRTREQVGTLVKRLISMTSDERNAVLAIPEALEAFQTAIDACWSSEAEKEVDARDWPSLIQFYDDQSEALASVDEASSLVFALRRAKAVVFADYMGRSEEWPPLVATRSGDAAVDFLLSYTEGCLTWDHRDPAYSVQALDEATSYTGDSFLYYRLDAMRRLAVGYARRREFDNAKARAIQAIRLTFNSSLMDLDRAEILLELAWIDKATQRVNEALGCIYASAREYLQTSGRSADPRYQEAYLKAVYGMPWLWYSTTYPGSVFPNWSGGVGLVPGVFTRRFTPQADYAPPLGFQPASLLLLAGLAASIHQPRLARSALRTAIAVSGAAVIPAMAVPTLAMVYARLGQSNEAVRMAVLASEQARTDNNNPLPWHPLRAFVWHYVIGPLVTEVVAGELPSESTRDLARSLQSLCVDDETEKYWLTASEYIASLVEAASTRGEPADVPPALAEYELIPRILYCVTHSLSDTTQLGEAVVDQMSAIALIYQNHSFQLLPPIQSRIVAFWRDVISNSRFALRSPDLYTSLFDDLLATSTMFQTAPRLILWAAEAIGIRLADGVQSQMKLWGDLPG